MWDLISIVIPKIKAHWVKVAYSLEYDIHAVKAFEQDHRNSEDRCKGLFENWLSARHGASPKTWQTLLERIQRVDDLFSVVDDIKKALRSK